MSLLVEVRRNPRIVDGELVNPGEVCWLPNSLAKALEKVGHVGWPGPEASLKAIEAKSVTRAENRVKVETKKAKLAKRKAN